MKNILVYPYKLNKVMKNKYSRYLWRHNAENLCHLGENSYMDFPYIINGGEYIIIGDNFHCCRGCRIQAIDRYENQTYTPKIVIGNNVSINMDAEISAINSIVIEDGVQMASNVLIVDHYHGKIDKSDVWGGGEPGKRNLYSKGPVRIEKNVWIGYGVAVLPNVTIGRGAIIGANSVITKSIAPYSVVAGVPGKIIKNLGDG